MKTKECKRTTFVVTGLTGSESFHREKLFKQDQTWLLLASECK